jgi:1-acyl-sn-glycerol-3-phosphate acyltransferase
MDFLRLVAFVISKTCWFVHYKGRENIPPPSASGLLITANHQTYVDPVWICLLMRRKFRFMAFDKVFEWRFIGPLITYLGAFPVPFEGSSTIKAMKEALRALKDGAVLTVFPEGAREFADGEMLPFKSGAVQLALHTGVPVLPVTVRGGNRIWPQTKKYPRLFRRVEIIYHPVINLAEMNEADPHDDLEYWTEMLREIIASGL